MSCARSKTRSGYRPFTKMRRPPKLNPTTTVKISAIPIKAEDREDHIANGNIRSRFVPGHLRFVVHAVQNCFRNRGIARSTNERQNRADSFPKRGIVRIPSRPIDRAYFLAICCVG